MSQHGQWQVAGSAPEVYERELVPAIFGPWAPILIELARPNPADRVLDVACGTGIVARSIAKRPGATGTVVGVDLNPGMLSIAQAALERDLHFGAPVRWQQASADKLPFGNQSFDIVYCQLGLQFFTDRHAALSEMRRVLTVEGKLALMVWRNIDASPGFAALADSLERHIGEAPAAIVRAPFALSDAEELTELVRAAGFENITVQQQVGTIRFSTVEKFVASYVAGSPLAAVLLQASDAARAAIIADATNALRTYVGAAEVAFPIAAHLLNATA